uniref:Acyl-CoA dehydrogenase family, member 11 n=1 Tax=Astyanax mexicanus TaxID=7994 RepID=A0A8B9HVT1_ASTMX
MEEETTPVRQQHLFNVKKLQKHLIGRLRGVSENTAVSVRQYSSGQSNPTFFIQTPDRSYVLRKKPPGPLLPGAHKVSPCFRQASADALHHQLTFHIMYITKPKLSKVLQHSEIFNSKFTLCLEAHCSAQSALPSTPPLNPYITQLCISSYFLIFSLQARVVAVLDWELSTTGQPIADLAYFLMPHYCPSHHGMISTLGGITGIEGIPPPEDLISIYCRCRGLPSSLPHQNFFIALAMFKMACIAQGIYARFMLGNASAPDAARYGDTVEPLAQLALKIAHSSSSVKAVVDTLFLQSPKGHAVLQQVQQFMKQHVLPAQQQITEYYAKHTDGPQRWQTPPVLEELKAKARAAGLWNLFLPAVSGLSQVDYSYIAEETGKCVFAAEVFNCQAPDSGNMEVLHLYGSEEQKKQWLEPLLRAEIRSCFCMTGNKTHTHTHTHTHTFSNLHTLRHTGAGNPMCKIAVVMCRSKTSVFCMCVFFRHGQHSMILVPMDTPGVKKIRPLTVFGQDDASHGGHFEVHFDNVRVPASNILLGEGRGFEIAQGRLGPGRLHHCMRAVGASEYALELLCKRAASRQTFGKKLYQHEVVAHWIAECRIAIEQTRLLALHAAHTLDTKGNKAARKQIGMIKVVAGRMASKVVDCAIQVHGGAGVSDDFPLAHMYAYARTLRLADGPDEVHLSSIAQMELRDQLRRMSAKL